MSNDHKKGPGGHYSGTNPIPNVQKFIQSLDADKKERDAQIEARMKANGNAGSDVQEHKPGKSVGIAGTRKTVTDPVTGKEVQIEDVNADFMKAVDNPKVDSCPFVFGMKTYM